MQTPEPIKSPAKPEPVARWENEGGPPPPQSVGKTPDPAPVPWYQQILRGGDKVNAVRGKLAAEMKARPEIALAAALGLGVVIGGGLRRQRFFRTALGLLAMPVLRRVIDGVKNA